MADIEPPITGNPTIDAALAHVASSEADVTEQARLLGQAQEVLVGVLRTSRESATTD